MRAIGFGVSGLISTIVCVLVLAAIWFDWYRSIPRIGPIDLHRWWVYGAAALAWLLTTGSLIDRRERLCYLERRESLRAAAGAVGLSRFEILSAIENERTLKNLRKRIATDLEWQA